MGWLIEMLLEAVKEKCSQFLIDMMELVTQMFTELLSCNLDLFEELFGVVGDLYRNVIVPLSIALLLLICVWQLFKSMFGRVGLNSEDPIELVCRSGACLFLIVGAKTVINYILDFAGTPYQWVAGTTIEVNSFSEYVSAAEGLTAALGIDSISVMLLMLIMQFVVAWNYFKMLFVIAERYVLLGVFSYTAPLAFATGGSKATNSILASWSKMFGGQVVLIIMNAWCMKMFLSGYGNMLASGYGFTKFFVATLCLIGFCKITFKLDSYMASLGVNLGRPSGGLGAMGLLMAAGRLFGKAGHSAGSAGAGGVGGEDASSAGAAAGMAAQGMAEGAGAPIPMGSELPGGFGTGESTEGAEEETGEPGFEGDDAEAQAEAMDQMENDNVLEALGEMPGENAGEEMTMGIGENTEQEETGDMALDGTEQISDMPEGESTEMFNQEENMEGLGDYPVNREEEQETEETEGEMDLEGTIPAEDAGTGEGTCGSAGDTLNSSVGVTAKGTGGSGAGTDAGIIEELGGSVSAGTETQQLVSGMEQLGRTAGLSEGREPGSEGIPTGVETAETGDFFEAAAGSMGAAGADTDRDVLTPEGGHEARFFEAAGNTEEFRAQQDSWMPVNMKDGQEAVETDEAFRSRQRNREEQAEPESRWENGYGKLPDVPKDRNDLKHWKQPDDDGNGPF